MSKAERVRVYRFILLSMCLCLLSRSAAASAEEEPHFTCKGAHIHYYYAFNVVLRDTLLTYDNAYEVFSSYDGKNETLNSGHFIQVNKDKLRAVGGHILAQNDLQKEKILTSYYPDAERCESLKFEGLNGGGWVAWYDGRFVTVEVEKEDVPLDEIIQVSALPQPQCKYIVTALTEALCTLYGQELFRLTPTECKLEENPGQVKVMQFQKSLPCELVYIDIAVSELVYSRAGITAKNKECLKYLKEEYDVHDVSEKGYFAYAVSAVEESNYFSITDTKERPFTSSRTSEWSEPDGYLNMLEIQRVCLEIQYYIEREKYNMGETSKKFQEYREEKDFEAFFAEYEEKTMTLDSLEVSLLLANRYLDEWEEKNTQSRSIQRKVDAKIGEVRGLILRELSYIEILNRQLEDEYRILEAQMSKESLEVSSKSLEAAEDSLEISKYAFRITAVLLCISVILFVEQLSGGYVLRGVRFHGGRLLSGRALRTKKGSPRTDEEPKK